MRCMWGLLQHRRSRSKPSDSCIEQDDAGNRPQGVYTMLCFTEPFASVNTIGPCVLFHIELEVFMMIGARIARMGGATGDCRGGCGHESRNSWMRHPAFCARESQPRSVREPGSWVDGLAYKWRPRRVRRSCSVHTLLRRMRRGTGTISARCLPTRWRQALLSTAET